MTRAWPAGHSDQHVFSSAHSLACSLHIVLYSHTLYSQAARQRPSAGAYPRSSAVSPSEAVDQRSREFLYMTSYSIYTFGIDMYVVLGNRCKMHLSWYDSVSLSIWFISGKICRPKKKERKEKEKGKTILVRSVVRKQPGMT